MFNRTDRSYYLVIIHRCLCWTCSTTILSGYCVSFVQLEYLEKHAVEVTFIYTWKILYVNDVKTNRELLFLNRIHFHDLRSIDYPN